MSISASAAHRLVFSVTMARLPLALGFFVCAYVPDSRARWAMVALCLLVELSDLVDGYLARRLGVATPLGGMIDSTVDHVARTTEAVALLAVGVLPAPLLVVMIGRDAAVSVIRQLLLRRSGQDGGTRWSGKMKGIAQGICLVTLTSSYAIAAQPTLAWRTLNSAVVAVALLVTVVSLLDYSAAYWRSTRPLPQPPEAPVAVEYR